ncbi:peptidoglycan D,D-transpeptidase FtsI family protein [Corynebacterium sp. 335C]
MNRSIRRAAMFALVLIVILLANLTWVQVFQREEYAENPLNNRQFMEEKSRPRGQISTGGVVLAHSVRGEGDYYVRQYGDEPEVYGPVVGYLSDVYGAAGLESSRNGILNGTDPSLATTRIMDTLTGKGAQGADLELTIDPEAQRTAYRQLADKGYVGAVVAMRPSTGEILAMASTPSYDPRPIVAGDQDTWSQLNADPDAPLLNHALQRPLPPGSTFKVLTTAAAIEKGANPSTPVTGAPSITLPNTTTTLENYGGSACAGGGQVTLEEAFRRSCNTAFVELGINTGADALRDVAKRFNVGETFEEIKAPQDPSTISEIPDDAALGQTAIGQRDVMFTPLQNAVIAATIANDGKMMSPHIVDKVVGKDLRVLDEFEPDEIREAIHPDTAEMLTGLMRKAESWSGGNGSRIASKTGTAEHGTVRGELAPHVWYIAFDEQADVAVSVVVENGGGQGNSATGGSVAAPVGRAVMQSVAASGR